MTPARRKRPGPGESDPWQEHWARALGLPDPVPCCLCDRKTPSADCQRWDLVRNTPAGWCLAGPSRRRPVRVKVCKDCCIRELDGHRCMWWDFCWGV